MGLFNPWWYLGHWHLSFRGKFISFLCKLVLLQDRVAETFMSGYYILPGAESWFLCIVAGLLFYNTVKGFRIGQCRDNLYLFVFCLDQESSLLYLVDIDNGSQDGHD